MTDYQFALLELIDRIDQICGPGESLGHAEITAMIIDRVQFPRERRNYPHVTG
jgi:hypothetical protein